jgi:hypothetical protein
MGHYLLLCLSLLFSVSAYAQFTPKKIALAEQFVKLLQLNHLHDDYLKECSKPDDSVHMAAEAYREHPESFDGLSPQSSYWGEVETVYSHYRLNTCGYITSEKVAQFFTQQSAERLSEEDLRASIAFYSSPAGLRLVASDVAANRAFQVYANELMRKAAEEAEDRYQREIAEVVFKFHADPKWSLPNHSVRDFPSTPGA